MVPDRFACDIKHRLSLTLEYSTNTLGWWEFNRRGWLHLEQAQREVRREAFPAGENDDHPFIFRVLER